MEIPLSQRSTASPGALSPFGTTDAAVRSLIVKSVSGGGEISANLLELIDQGYQRVPAAARGPATTAAFAWAKSYVSSPAFAAAYAEARDVYKPAGSVDTDSVDVAVQKELAGLIAQLEESKKNLSMLDAATRAKVIKSLDDQIVIYKNPDTARQLRAAKELQRGAASADNATTATEFAAKWPADPKAYVKRQLERFMAATTTIDYSLAKIWVKDSSGKIEGFLSPGLEDIAWEAMHAILAGKEAVDAARTFVAAWLKELP